MSTWDSSRKPFWCTYRFPWQPNNQCPGTLRLGHIYCWPGDGGVQRSENCWKRGSGLNKQDIDINDKIYNTLSLKFKVNQDGHPKDAEKRSLYDDDFSIDYLHVDACICKQHSCCRLLQIKTHNSNGIYIITTQKIWYCLYSTFLLFISTLIYMYRDIVFSKKRFFFLIH